MAIQMSLARVSVGFQSRERQSSLVFLCYENPQKRLLRKLLLEFLIVEKIKFLESQSKARAINVEFVNATLKLSLEQLARRLQVIREFKFIPLKGSECRCTVLAETCRTAGIEEKQNPVNYSCRVCNKRARKIRNIGKLYRKHQGYFHQHRKIDHCTDP